MWYSPKYILDSVIGFTEKLRYQKPTAFYGLRFEEWVVRWSNIVVDSCKDCGGYWILKDWRGDKSYFRHCIDRSNENGSLENKKEDKETKSKRYKIIPKSSLYPDLTLEAADREEPGFWKVGTKIYVECKWTQKGVFYLKKDSIQHYDDFLLEVLPDSRYTDRLKRLFFVFGIGWDTIKGRPKKAYCIRAKKLYEKIIDERPIPLEYGWQNAHEKGRKTLTVDFNDKKFKTVKSVIRDTGEINLYYV